MMKIVMQDVRLIQLCTIASIFSQIEVVSSIFRPLMYVLWILIIGYYIVNNVHAIILNRVSQGYLLSYVLLLVFCIFSSLVGSDHLNGNYLHIMTIPLLVTVVGGFFGSTCTAENLQTVLKTYLVCTLIYAFWVNITYYASYSNWMNQTKYAFLQKNSAAQIWSVGVLIALFLIQYKSKIQRFIGYIISLYLIIICGLSQCRTALLALAVAACGYIFFRSKHKLRWGIVLIALCMAMWNLPMTRKFIDQALLLNKYAGADMNTFSSGRLGHWKTAIDTFKNNPIFGIGKYYVDCSYLCVLAEVGLVGFLLIESIWILRIYYNLKNKNGIAKEFLFCITVFYLVESLLEGYPPFGPGVSSFMFWFLSSAYMSGFDDRYQMQLES